jgi:hypothetical protein
MKINNAILIERRKPKRRIHSKTPVETRPTNDFGGSIKAIQEKTPTEALKR